MNLFLTSLSFFNLESSHEGHCLLDLSKLGLFIVVGKLEEQLAPIFYLEVSVIEVAFTSNPEGQHHILFQDCLALGVDCTKICVLEQTDDVNLCGLLHCHECARLKA